MKSLKQIVKETVAQPKSPDEKRFKELHTKNVKVVSAPGEEDVAKAKKSTNKKPRFADYTSGKDVEVYDTSYAESVDLTDFLTLDENVLEEHIFELSETQLDELIKTATKAFAIGTAGAGAVKKAANKIKSRFSAGGRADALEKRTKEIEKKRKERERLATARQNLAKVKRGGRTEEVDLDENAWEEVPMMQRQLEFIAYAADEICDYLDSGIDPEEWYQNKLAVTASMMEKLYSYAQGEMRMMSRSGGMGEYDYDYGSPYGGYNEEVEINESVIDDLKDIVKRKSMKDVKFTDGQKLKVDLTTASILLKLHDSLNSKNQQTFANAVNKDETGFMKMVDFAFSKVG